MIHKLKTIDPHYDDVSSGIKTFSVRLNDRNFRPGDTVIFQQYDRKTETYSGFVCIGKIDCVLRDFVGLIDDYCVFSFHLL